MRSINAIFIVSLPPGEKIDTKGHHTKFSKPGNISNKKVWRTVKSIANCWIIEGCFPLKDGGYH